MQYQMVENELTEAHEIEYSLLEELVEGLEDEDDEELPEVEEVEKVFDPILEQFPWIRKRKENGEDDL